MTRPKIKDEQLRRITQTCRLPRYLVNWLDKQDESAGIIIERALTCCYDVPAPDDKPIETTCEKIMRKKWIWIVLALSLFAAELGDDVDRRYVRCQCRVRIGRFS